MAFLYKTASSRKNKINTSLAETAWGHPPKQKEWEPTKPSQTFLPVFQERKITSNGKGVKLISFEISESSFKKCFVIYYYFSLSQETRKIEKTIERRSETLERETWKEQREQ